MVGVYMIKKAYYLGLRKWKVQALMKEFNYSNFKGIMSKYQFNKFKDLVLKELPTSNKSMRVDTKEIFKKGISKLNRLFNSMNSKIYLTELIITYEDEKNNLRFGALRTQSELNNLKENEIVITSAKTKSGLRRIQKLIYDAEPEYNNMVALLNELYLYARSKYKDY